ncbi:hypothetical protein RJ639_031574 [Escallonia herrerae]|uniref:Uncharacterized protein n=1 Tax=Escallonia herrerae TaxID=1293975 RepID=A0AA88X1U7_9ASTE|nr:hypothetical protein RJ639_031574 [Escallonia herrerae]
MALEWLVLGYATAAEAIMVLLLTLPGLNGLRKGLIHRHPQPPQALPLGNPVLPVPVDGHLLEVRDSAALRVARFVHPGRAPPPPEVRHEEPAERAAHRRRAPVLLASVLGHALGCSDGAVESAGRENEEERGLNLLSLSLFFTVIQELGLVEVEMEMEGVRPEKGLGSPSVV